MLERIITWASGQVGIRAAALVGSAARLDHPADEWSDLDLVLVAADPRAYLGSTAWLAELGEVWFSYQEFHFEGQEACERRILFAGGQDVDFMVYSIESARQGFAGTFVPEIAARGLRVLLDKDGILPPMPVATLAGTVQPPSWGEFSETVNDFWFHAVWTAKKLRRGELWTAIRCCDDYLKRLLLRMLEWQAQAAQEGTVDTWFNGRFMEQWASPAALEKLRIAFAHYDEQDIWRALRVSMELFDQVAKETAAGWGYTYPAENVEKVMRWVEECQGGRNGTLMAVAAE
jgi:aminoglycoside 6-adenylyltransferase